MNDVKSPANSVPIAGVIGHPIAQSRSPQLFAHWFKTYACKGFYVPMPVLADDLERVLRVMPAMGIRGCNVTAPHKVAALEIADIATERATQIGAANTLTFQADGAIHADNTDGYGFIANLKQGAPAWEAARGPAAVLGAGGAARAIIAALIDAGVAEILLANRTEAKAEDLRAAFGPKVTVMAWARAEAMIAEAATVVNTTSLGMLGKPELRVSLKGVRRDAVVTDLVYNPLQTPFLREAEAAGCETVDGLGMLLHQAVPGFERWFGLRPEVDQATRAAVLA